MFKNSETKLFVSARGQLNNILRMGVNVIRMAKTVNQFRKERVISSKTISLHDNNSIISDPNHVCNIFNARFSTIADDFGKPEGMILENTIPSHIVRHNEHLITIEI